MSSSVMFNSHIFRTILSASLLVGRSPQWLPHKLCFNRLLWCFRRPVYYNPSVDCLLMVGKVHYPQRELLSLEICQHSCNQN